MNRIGNHADPKADLNPMWEAPANAAETARRRHLGALLRPGVIALAALSVTLWIVRLGFVLYALQLFDIALPSHSPDTIAGFLSMAVGLVGCHAALSALRRRTLRQIAAVIDSQLAGGRPSEPGSLEEAGGKSLDRLHRLLVGGAVPLLIDLAALPIFIVLMFGLGWPMALAAIAFALGAAALLLLGGRGTVETAAHAETLRGDRDRLRASARTDRMLLASQGMGSLATTARRVADLQAADAESRAAAAGQRLDAGMATLSAIAALATTALAAWRIIGGHASTGTLGATFILTLLIAAPLWGLARHVVDIAGLHETRARLRALIATEDGRAAPINLPPPKTTLTVEGLGIAVPGEDRALLQRVDFTATAGDVIALVGSGGVGKTALLSAIAGIAKPVAGQVRLDGSTLDQWDADTLARHIGYLPQLAELIDGSVFQNIARFDPTATSASIIAAARAAGVHDMIVRLPQGYDTPVGPLGERLAASERQRIGLARALYGDPFLILLDDPGSTLDPQSSLLLSEAIRRASDRGAIVIGSGNSAAVIGEAKLLLVLRPGGMLDFGPASQVRERMAKRRRPRLDQPPSPAPHPTPERLTE